MPGNGWVSVYRKITEHWLWHDKPFSKGQAWIDILLMVNHKEQKILFNNQVMTVEEGEKITSIRKLCDRWGWSNTKVKNFLELLEKEKMITYKSDTKKTVLKVLNYNDYQKKDIAETSQKHHRNDTETSLKHTNNNDNNDNNDNKNNMSPSSEIEKIYNSLTDYWKKLFQDYIEIYKSKNSTGKITDNRHYNLLNEIYQIYVEKKFVFDGKEYRLTDKIMETGLNKIIEKNIDSLNYAKKVWIGEPDKKPAKKREKHTENRPMYAENRYR